MTKAELIQKIDGISGRMDELVGDMKTNLKDAQTLLSKIEDLPTESSEIDDDEDKDKDEK